MKVRRSVFFIIIIFFYYLYDVITTLILEETHYVPMQSKIILKNEELTAICKLC